mmetsp:Transcript_29767/g.54237  ORF Transcript_29767/g.54237 Transcript_29767/m.54237 type:complete len:213 (-) Transcript_29767:1075-1713(-)
MFRHRLLRGRIHRDQDLLCAPVELHIVVALEWEDHGCHRGTLPLAHEVKIQHALHRTVLQAVDDCSGVWRGCDQRLFVACWRSFWRSALLASFDRNQSVRRWWSWCSKVRLWQWVNNSQSHGHHRSDVSLRTIELDAKTELVTRCLHLPQALQVVGTGSSYPNLDVVLLDLRGILIKSFDEACEGSRNISEVRDATADDQELALWVLVAKHQ